MRDNHAITIMTKEKQIGDCFILMAEVLTIREAIMMAIQQNFQSIIIESDSQLVINSIHDKICVPKNVINLVKDITMLYFLFKDIRTSYCNRLVNRDIDPMAKMLMYNLYGLFTYLLLCLFILIIAP